MKFPTVLKCFCCVDLRLAGILIGILSIVAGIYDIATGGAWSIVSMINVPLSILWIYGIFREQPMLMLPTIIADAICVIFLFLVPIYTTVAYLQIDDRSIDEKTTNKFAIFLTAEILTVILVVYFYIVEFSLYRVIVNKRNSPARAGSNPVQYDA